MHTVRLLRSRSSELAFVLARSSQLTRSRPQRTGRVSRAAAWPHERNDATAFATVAAWCKRWRSVWWSSEL